ncbi:MAG: glycosyltransferase family 2 protein [Marinagarivorans sp.]|nr:glycosyltransferase family 2 protein [Marinagarivorans sp.]
MNSEPVALSIIIPAKNEEKGLALILPTLKSLYPAAQIIVVSDGSTDATNEVAKYFGVDLVVHPYSKGNGASIKSGLRHAKGDVVVCMDADGQHQPEDIPLLLAKLDEGAGYDMVVGARDHAGQANVHRSLANSFYNKFSSWMVGHKIQDLTSGFRAVRRKKFLEFISLLPNKFSYPTTITMSFFRSGYSVAYVPIAVQQRVEGTQSHVRLVADGIRFLIIIFKIGTLFSPLKLFAPISVLLFTSGMGYYLYTYLGDGRFTNMGVLLFSTAIIVFLMGLVSEQVTALLYKDSE